MSTSAQSSSYLEVPCNCSGGLPSLGVGPHFGLSPKGGLPSLGVGPCLGWPPLGGLTLVGPCLVG